MCPPCHKLVDDDPETYSRRTLEAYKRNHEKRVRYVVGLGPDRQQALRERGARGGKGDWQQYGRVFLRAQRAMERRHRRQRVDLMVYEKQRQEILKDLGADPYVD